MKKFLISLILLIPFVTGCADIDSKLTINDDRSASIATSLTYRGNLADKSDIIGQNISSNYDKFLDPYYKVQTAYGASLSTITATKRVPDLKLEDLDLSSLGFVSKLPGGKFVEIRKNFLVSSFNVDCVYNYANIAKKVENISLTDNNTDIIKGALQPEYYHKYGAGDGYQTSSNDTEFDLAANLDESAKQLIKDDNEDAAAANNAETTPVKDLQVSFSIQVPAFASYNNADSVRGNVYIWNLNKKAPTEIKLQYVQYSGFAIAFVILLGILLLVIISRKILKRDSQKRLDNIENIV